MKFKLFFDTSDMEKIIVRLYKDGILLAEKSGIRRFTSQILLSEIEEICRENKITPNDISEIDFNPGPGSYTGLKVGAAVANAFGWHLKIPVNGQKSNIALPVFE